MSYSNQNEHSLFGRVFTSLRSFRRLYLLIAALILSVTFYVTFFAPSGLTQLKPPSWHEITGSKTHHGSSATSTAAAPYQPTATHQSTHTSASSERPYDAIPQTNLPEGVKVIGLVFFGRREMVRSLDCYLRRNLKKNGGLLDEVIFAMNTDEGSRLKPEDKKYLEEELLPSEPAYRSWMSEVNYKWWLGNWAAVQDPNAIYVKIDDDVVFVEDTAIPSIVKRLYENEDIFAVSANVVNNPALSWVHNHLGVYHPYWPETEKPAEEPSPSWRASELPTWKGPETGPQDFKMNGDTPAPFVNHRWLPVPMKKGEYVYDRNKFPESTVTYDAFGPSLWNWAQAAQLHYSFLQNLEEENIWKYKFGMWDYQWARLSINFIAFRGSDIIEAFPFPVQDDEHYLTERRPSEVKKKVVVDGSGVVVHFNFGPQFAAHDEHGVRDTDLLTRYSLYAKEKVCGRYLS